ncbi:hypothetical protein ACTM4A_18825 [Citrobacter freundii]
MSIDKIKLVGNEKWEPLKGLNVQFYMDSSTGKFKVISTYNDMLIKSVILEGGVAARASSLSLILRDLESAYGWYKRALEIVQSDSIKNDSDDDYIEIDNLSISSEARAFFVASITFYGKAFTEAVGRKLKMEKKWLDPRFHEMHDTFIEYRHNFAAHSGSESFEHAKTILILVPHKSRGLVYQPMTVRGQLSVIITPDSNVNELFEHAIETVTKKYTETLERIRKYVFTMPGNYWVTAAGGNGVVNLDVAIKNKK